MIASLLKRFIIPTVKKPLDQLQLEAAQDRLDQRSTELDKGVDELSKMIRRLKRDRGKKK